MYGRALLMTVAAGACSHTEPARAASVECHSAANARPVAGLSGDEACALVRARVQGALGNARRANLSIELDLSRPGSAIARMAGQPEIAVDVMDRALQRSDLVRLADAIVAALGGPQGQ